MPTKNILKKKSDAKSTTASTTSTARIKKITFGTIPISPLKVAITYQEDQIQDMLKKEPAKSIFKNPTLLKAATVFQAGKIDLACIMLYREDATAPTFETHHTSTDKELIDWLDKYFHLFYADLSWTTKFNPEVYSNWREPYLKKIQNHLKETNQEFKLARPRTEAPENAATPIKTFNTSTLYQSVKKELSPVSTKETRWIANRITMGIF